MDISFLPEIYLNEKHASFRKIRFIETLYWPGQPIWGYVYEWGWLKECRLHCKNNAAGFIFLSKISHHFLSYHVHRGLDDQIFLSQRFIGRVNQSGIRIWVRMTIQTLHSVNYVYRTNILRTSVTVYRRLARFVIDTTEAFPTSYSISLSFYDKTGCPSTYYPFFFSSSLLPSNLQTLLKDYFYWPILNQFPTC